MSSKKEKYFISILKMTNKYKFYAVKVGRKPGVYDSWNECKKQVDSFSNPKFKGFNDKDEAHKFLTSEPINNVKQNHKTAKVKRELNNDTDDDDDDGNINERSSGKKARVDDIKVEENEDIEVYTDGACRGNGKARASATIGVYWGPNNQLNLSEKLLGKPTNQRAELNAAIRALEQAVSQNYKSITICTDSKYTMKCMTEWVKNWKKNNWIKPDKQPVLNKEDIVKLDNLCSKIKVHWKYVPGHKGILGNEEADRLANEAFSK